MERPPPVRCRNPLAPGTASRLGAVAGRLRRGPWRAALSIEWYHAGVRRIGRYILNALTVLSLVLCVATVGMWVRSYWVGSTLSRVSQNGWVAGDGGFETESQFALHIIKLNSERG